MTAPGANLDGKLLALARWEKRKRLEETVLLACCAALAVAVVLLPLNGLLPHPWLRWLVPVALLACLIPFFLYRQRWTARDQVRALVALDRTLNLDERALTAWDLTARRDTSPAAQMVLQEAERSLRSIEPRTLFPRRRSWAAMTAPGLLAIWLMLLWLEVDRPEDRTASTGQTLAQKAREYARELQEKARNENLRESLKMSLELEKVARRGTERKSPDEQFKKELSAIAQKFDDAAKAGAQKDSTGAETGETLKDLQAELAALRDLPELPALPNGAEQPGRQWAERLASMPQLKRQMNEAEQAGRGSSEGDLKAFLQQLERRVAAELDRRALIDAQQYLKKMMNQGGPKDGENFAQRRHAARDEQGPGDGQREKNASNLPGKEPGHKGDEAPSLPEFRTGPSTQVQGALKEGESTALSFKGKPAPGTSAVPPSDVVAAYRRQAEQELSSERVPAGLKEVIRNYFLTLGDGGK